VAIHAPQNAQELVPLGITRTLERDFDRIWPHASSAMTIEQLNVLTPDSPAALLIRAIAEYEREWASIEVWPDLGWSDAEIDDALNLIY